MKTLLRRSTLALLIATAALAVLPSAAHGPNCIGVPNAPGPVVIAGTGCYVLLADLAGAGLRGVGQNGRQCGYSEQTQSLHG